MLEAERNKLTETNAELVAYADAKVLATDCIGGFTDTKEHKESSVNSLVQECYPDKSFTLEPVLNSSKSAVTGLQFMVHNDGYSTPLNKDGAGVQSSVSYTLDLINTAFNPELKKLKVYDEPFIHVAKDRLEKFVPVFVQVAEQLGIQTIIVTHEQFVKENTIKLTKINGEVTVDYV
jgi:hypothetical protein